LTETERVNWLSTLDKRVPAEIMYFQPSFTAITDIVEQLKKTKQKLRYERQESQSDDSSTSEASKVGQSTASDDSKNTPASDNQKWASQRQVMKNKTVYWAAFLLYNTLV
jgi:hypothetical protein